ncbi:polysaccharide deacetylase family protein [Actinomadura kijaniata]|uniref:polysaccharide deacetylase family protein n=1 Tax=Actinomadura kijaniata TaxID=46161 RepID=UPI003F1D278B
MRVTRGTVLAMAGTMAVVAGCGGMRAGQIVAARSSVPAPGGPSTPTPTPPPPRAIDCARTQCVALTFDDGPGEHTGRLLDDLRREGARATFFLLGQNVGAHRDLVRRMVLEGHEVANHSWSHPQLTGMSPDAVRSQVRRTSEAVREASGVTPTLFRPPYGATDGTVARAVGMPQILWSVDTLDWRDRSAARVVRVGVREPRKGGIVLLHDIHRTTVEAVPRVLSGLKKRGFTLVTVSEMFQGRQLRPGQKYEHR